MRPISVASLKVRLRQFGVLFLAMIALSYADVCLAAETAPFKIRLGYGVAVEEPLWLMLAKPQLATHEGHEYSLQTSRFSGADKRMQAFAAGALDISTVSANAAIFAASQGVDFKIIGSLSRESLRGFATQFMVRTDSPIKTAADLKGKTIGINGFSGSGNLWVDIYLKDHGLTEDDVTLVPVDFAAQGDALRAGKIDVGMFPQPFAAMVQKQGGVRTLFTSKDAVPKEEELMLIIAHDSFLKAHPDAVKAFMSDVVSATTTYSQHMQDARQAILDAKLVRVAPDIYLHMTDYYRDPTCRPDLAELEMMQDQQMKAGFQQKRADLKSRVDDAYLPSQG